MSNKDSNQTLIPRDDDEQWEKVLRGEIAADADNNTHTEAKELRKYLLRTEMAKALDSVPSLNTISVEEAKLHYQHASEEIHRRADRSQKRWINYGLVSLLGIMAGLITFFAAHYFSEKSDAAAGLAASKNSNRVNSQTFADKYAVINNGKSPGDLPNLLPIPSGTLAMGCNNGWDDIAGGCRENEYPSHTVTIDSFEMSQHEVTILQFKRFIDSSKYQTIAESRGCVIADRNSPSPRWIMDKTASWKSPGFEQEDTHPAVCLTRQDALAYIDWLNKETGKKFRLPTEAEWEYAARAGSGTPYSWGNKADHNRANFKGTGGVDIWEYTSPVGSFPANDFNIQDMSGNAWEWVSDCWHDNYVSAPNNGSSWNTNCNGSDYIVRRGGAWDAGALNIRSSYRSHAGELDRSQSYGFRVAHDMEKQTTRLETTQ